MTELNIALLGSKFMGKIHSNAWAQAPRFFDLEITPVMHTVAARDAAVLEQFRARWGWQHATTDVPALLADPAIGLVDIGTPNDAHRDAAVAALEAGKHVACEKPLAGTLADARAMAAAAQGASGRTFVWFSYRRVPAIALAHLLVAQGRLGAIRQVRAAYLQDWLADPEAPLSWRLDKQRAGSGALGDIGAHIVDLVQFNTAQRLTGVSALLETFVHERPVAAEFSGLHGRGGEGRGPVTVDDAAVFTARLSGGGIGVFEATRYAWGRKNAIRLEINGTTGSIAFDFEDMNVLNFYDATQDAVEAGFRRIVVTEPGHPYIAAWWPAGHGLGYEHAFTHQVVDLVGSIAAGRQPEPSFADGLQVQRVLGAVERSALADSVWTAVPDS